MLRGRADEHVLGIQRLVGNIGDQAGAEPVVVLLADRPVDLAPPDLRVAGWFLDQELVLRGAAGVLAGPDNERALRRDHPFAGPDRVLVQLRDAQIGPHGASQRVARGRTASWALGSCGAGGHLDLLSCAGRLVRPESCSGRRPAALGFGTSARWLSARRESASAVPRILHPVPMG